MQNMSEIDLFNTLIQYRKLQGPNALAALLKKLGVKSPSEIDAARFPEVAAMCKAGTRGVKTANAHDSAAASAALDKAVEAAVTRRFGGAQGVDIEAAVTVVRSAPTLQEGLSRLATAVHSRNRG